MSVNKAILVGRLGQDPDVRNTPGGQTVASLSVATSERFQDRDGQRQERTEWHRVVVWGKTAEACGQYLQKGREVYVEGRIQTREWQDKDGQPRRTTEIVATEVKFLGSSKDGSRESAGGQAAGGQAAGGQAGRGSQQERGAAQGGRWGQQSGAQGGQSDGPTVRQDLPF